MTCREFMDVAESLTPSQLLRQTEDKQMSAHAGECAVCGKWLESQRLLDSALQALHVRTALREASPKVEQAVLQAFRRHGFKPTEAVAPESAAPAAWKLSRVFGFGAYAAVAAALIVGVFVGARMWRDRQATPTQVQGQNVTAPQRQVNSEAPKVVGNSTPSATKATEIARNYSHPVPITGNTTSPKRTKLGHEQAAAINIDRQGFVALMFCDPLICSGEEQVIRMELPATGTASADGSSSQPVIADVIVGDDGLVRAMRIVN